MSARVSRRNLLVLAATVPIADMARTQSASASDVPKERPADTSVGVLVDTTVCIGCRQCEAACSEAHGFDQPSTTKPEDQVVFEDKRRPEARSFTVVNRHQPAAPEAPPTYVKLSCMHCVEPACVSACLVSALTKLPHGPVVYNADNCMGCRYCMVACPFEIPSYDYDHPFTPQVRKCNLCAHQVPEEHSAPACVRNCPVEALTYGPRDALVAQARERIERQPERYQSEIYGEKEVGGTSVMYLAGPNFSEIGLWGLQSEAPSRLTEKIQHNIFKKFIPPVMLYGLLGLAMWSSRPRLSGPGQDAEDHAHPNQRDDQR